MLAPKAALWMKLPPQVVLPEDAIKPRNANSAGQKQNGTQDRERNQGFQQAGRNAWGPNRGRGPRNSEVKAKDKVKAK